MGQKVREDTQGDKNPPSMVSQDMGLVTRLAPATPTAAPPAAQAPAAPAVPALDEAVLERAGNDLAQFLGPIARVLVQKRSGEASSVEELYEQLAAELERDEREAFMALMPSRTST